MLFVLSICSADDEVLQRLSSTFSAETKARDDETHMCVHQTVPGYVVVQG